MKPYSQKDYPQIRVRLSQNINTKYFNANTLSTLSFPTQDTIDKDSYERTLKTMKTFTEKVSGHLIQFEASKNFFDSVSNYLQNGSKIQRPPRLLNPTAQTKSRNEKNIKCKENQEEKPDYEIFQLDSIEEIFAKKETCQNEIKIPQTNYTLINHTSNHSKLSSPTSHPVVKEHPLIKAYSNYDKLYYTQPPKIKHFTNTRFHQRRKIENLLNTRGSLSNSTKHSPHQSSLHTYTTTPLMTPRNEEIERTSEKESKMKMKQQQLKNRAYDFSKQLERKSKWFSHCTSAPVYGPKDTYIEDQRKKIINTLKYRDDILKDEAELNNFLIKNKNRSHICTVIPLDSREVRIRNYIVNNKKISSENLQKLMSY